MKTIRKKRPIFETSDISLAAALYALGTPIIDIDRKEVGRCAFVFEDSGDLQVDVRDYWNKRLSIEPQALLSGLKAIKARLYGEQL